MLLLVLTVSILPRNVDSIVDSVVGVGVESTLLTITVLF